METKQTKDSQGNLTIETFVYDGHYGYEWYVVTAMFGKMIKTLAVLGSRNEKGKYDFSLSSDIITLTSEVLKPTVESRNEIINIRHPEALEKLKWKYKLIIQ